jgi:hypothetical protein
MVRFKRLSDGTDGRRTTFLLYKGYVHKSKKSKTFLAFLDISKAFDRAWREGLFYLL